MLKRYQPERPDLLINTDWGIPRDDLTAEEARNRRLVLFHGRWVARAERKQLRDERNAYHSIRITGIAMMLFPLLVAADYGAILRGGVPAVLAAVLYAVLVPAAGYRLTGYSSRARIVSLAVFFSFLVLPFVPPFADDKASPVLIFLGLVGLNYLLRGTARKICTPPSGTEVSALAGKYPAVRRIVYGAAFVLLLIAGFVSYDLHVAARMAADVCSRAQTGTALEAYLGQIDLKAYRIVRGSGTVSIVPKRGMGRSHCTVSHDGRTITGARTGFAD